MLGEQYSLFLISRDPDENGVELHGDRPKEMWTRTPDGKLAMVTRRVDFGGLLGEFDRKG